MDETIFKFLKKVPLFEGLSDEDLIHLCDLAKKININKGEILVKEGDKGEEAFIIQDGTLEIIKSANNREVLLAVRESGDVIGEVSLLQESPRTATIRARTNSNLIIINKEQFNTLINNSSSAARTLFYTILSRWKSTESMLKQSEKMAQLGTLSAGVAHELNNPAAAVKRSSDLLHEEITKMINFQTLMTGISFSTEESALLNSLTFHTKAKSQEVVILDSLERSDKEYEYEEYLEDKGIKDAWELASVLVDLDLSEEQLNEVIDTFSSMIIPTIIKWFGALINVQSLTREINQGSGRISEIVKALKTYSYLDQAPAQIIDLHEGLDTTLVILKSKLKNIKVVRLYDQNIPKLYAYGSELNQVWTNLLDNAADALNESDGETKNQITIRTGLSKNSDFAIIEIEDNGTGIPEDIQGKIFDSFFTTKAVGKGTGLGLDISYNIVVNKHLGNIKVFSKPGQTVFQVMLPLDLENSNKDQIVITQEWINYDDSKLISILEQNHNIAAVGLTAEPSINSYDIPYYLQERQYNIIPVNPKLKGETVLDKVVFGSLKEVKEKIDLVLIFGPAEIISDIVDEVISLDIKVIWMQEGCFDEKAARKAQNAGIEVIMDKCIRHTMNTLLPKD